jgi:hypothetical protein
LDIGDPLPDGITRQTPLIVKAPPTPQIPLAQGFSLFIYFQNRERIIFFYFSKKKTSAFGASEGMQGLLRYFSQSSFASKTVIICS